MTTLKAFQLSLLELFALVTLAAVLTMVGMSMAKSCRVIFDGPQVPWRLGK